MNEVHQQEDVHQEQKDVQKEFPELFKGLGKMKNAYKITLDKNAQPFSIPIRKKVEDELKEMEKQDIIRPVTEPTDWCAPIVAVPKANGRIRLCVDFTRLNESVQRENFPLPATDQLLAQLSGATVFSKLNCNSGFFQVPLDEESQKLTTFITPLGRFCFKRLPFGISSGPEVFQREMTPILSEIPGVICDIDDVLISGKDQKEHDDRLRAVLQRMKEAGLTLDEKCIFNVDTIKFLGHIISKEGIQIDPDKVSAITKRPRPQNVAEVCRFLGIVNHIGKFAPNLAETTKPLQDLLKKEVSWIWDDPQEKAFQKLKKQLSTASVLIHYSPLKATKISTDASSYGMGGVLLQKEGEDWKLSFMHRDHLLIPNKGMLKLKKKPLQLRGVVKNLKTFLLDCPISRSKQTRNLYWH